MLCLGRSNFFRFNHPQEAKFMRSVLPNTRVSMMPNAFCLVGISDDMSAAESKLSFESRRSYDSPDSWCEVSSATSSEDLLNSTPSIHSELMLPYSKHISPKVFLPGSSTLNSPASVVLGRHNKSSSPGGGTIAQGPKNATFYNNSVSVYEDRVESEGPGSGRSSGAGEKVMVNGNCVSDQNNNDGRGEDSRNDDKNSVKFSSSESLSPKQKIVPPSPAFNRNPSYFSSKCSSPNNEYGAFSSSPLFSSSPRFSNGHASGSKLDGGGGGPLSSPTASVAATAATVTFDSVGNAAENGFRRIDSEVKRRQAHHNRILEQERERVERLRLEEILTACTDYEKQAQYDRSNKPQVRIKTNGSLSRDKQSLSPLAKTPESPKNGFVFTFDKPDFSASNNENNVSNYEKPAYLSSPRTRIRTVASPKVIRKDYSFEIVDRLAALDEYKSSKLSPNVRRVNITENKCSNAEKQLRESIENHHMTKTENDDVESSFTSALDSKILRKYEFLGIDPTTVMKNDPVKSNSLMSRSYHESLSPASESGENSPNMMSVSLINFDSNGADRSKHDFSNFSSNEYTKSKSQTLSQSNKSPDNGDDIEKLNGLVSELNDIIKNSPTSYVNEVSTNGNLKHMTTTSPNKFILPLAEILQVEKESKFILPLEEIDSVLRRQRFSVKKCELKKLQNEQSRLMDAINKVKSKLLDIQQQKDEIIRELEMEKALLEGELKSENDKLTSQEQMLNIAHEKMNHCEKQIEFCSKQQNERQDQNKSIVDEQQNILNVLQSNLSCIKNESDKISIIESMKRSREILEEETKSYEDFEFRLLEEEASLLSKRDELQGDLSKLSNDIEHTRMKISGLYTQKEQLLQNASDEIKSLELQVRCHTRTLQQNHGRLQDISVQLKETSKYFNEVFEEGADSSDEHVYPYKTQSQEDLDRISRVTSDAPIMESSCTNSLGRRTIASLQQIERNRQLHLAQQGSQVIEEERKRMLALKQRVQDEVKAQWEEDRKQRENNCNSITSMGSDNSSILSSDRLTNSPNNDEKLPVAIQSENSRVVENGNSVFSKTSSTHKDDKDEERPSKKRHSNAAALTSSDNDMFVKLRTNKSLGVYQRPESRFSVYRRQSLDLRQHIETAGHSHCPQVFLDRTSCRGYLQKMTTKFRSWNKRWFVFDRVKCSFTYYSDKSEKKLKGGAHFKDLLDLCMEGSNSIRSPNPHATFVVKSAERVYYLQAPSKEAMRIWFDVLATEIETYQDT